MDTPVLPFNVAEHAITLRQFIDLIEEQPDETLGCELSSEGLYDALSRLHSAAVKFDPLTAKLQELGSMAFDHEIRIMNDNISNVRAPVLQRGGQRGGTE
jgi:N-acetylated-alpha-linked acidic dipeptidase